MTILLNPESEDEEPQPSQETHTPPGRSRSEPRSQVLNFLWLNLELPPLPDPEDGSIRQPMPENYIENVRKAAWRHPRAQVVLWVDSQRLTKKQMDYLKESIEQGRPNVRLKDLRSIPEYNEEDLYNKAETNANWRSLCQKSLIWRQVDAAKILVSLQGNYEQTFFADMDYAGMNIESQKVQDMLKKPGLFIGSGEENQLWGFTRARRGFFEDYYKEALKVAYGGNNAWSLLLDKMASFRWKENMQENPCLFIDNDHTSAEQPGSECRNGSEKQKDPLRIPAGRLAGDFRRHSRVRSSGPALLSVPIKYQAAPRLVAAATL